ncbi:CHAD domain-containing protein [Amycolatopsis sp. WGS_07]|uniref:CHAD domain-containing protein n=1 Tax=Amycolatopsis sp. WGS_07 TaxID=3076764 RepID=UPI003872DF69
MTGAVTHYDTTSLRLRRHGLAIGRLAERFREGLRWLGAARDVDVQRARFFAALETLPPESISDELRSSAEQAFAAETAETAETAAECAVVLDSLRYLQLLNAAVHAVRKSVKRLRYAVEALPDAWRKAYQDLLPLRRWDVARTTASCWLST